MAALANANPRMLAMANKILPIERTVVALIGNAVSTGDALLAYEKFGRLIPAPAKFHHVGDNEVYGVIAIFNTPSR